MKTIVIANWKMNPTTLAEAKKLFDSVVKGIKNVKKAEVVICPPFIYLSYLVEFLSRWRKCQLKFGAQDCFWEESGAFTGEVSPKMLKNFACQYIIVGHSERRKYLSETDEMANKKVKAALKIGLKPILCVDKALQVKKGLKEIPKGEFKNVIVAFEPLFAIGTGKPCSPEKAEKMRKAIAKTANQDTPILYGGSVNSQNAISYRKVGFDGLLVGGASLDPPEFLKIIKSID